jgi:hypothetical protein
MSRSSRFPLVLQACLHSLPTPYSVAERLGILPFCRHAISDPTRPGRDVGLVIGPRESWFNADRAYQLQTDEAWRVLQDEHSIEQIGAMLLASVPECQGSIKIFGVDRDNLWAIGRHPEMLWFWHFESLFRVLDTTATSTPPPSTPPAPTSTTAPTATAPPTPSTPPPSTPPTPAKILIRWRDIVETLPLRETMPQSTYEERRRRLAYLNQRYGGPIQSGGKGSQPRVDLAELLDW